MTSAVIAWWRARAARWPGTVGGALRDSRGGLLALALLVGAGAGLGAVAFRYLIVGFTWLATGHAAFGQQGYAGSAHLPWLGLAFFVVIPVVGGLVYGPLIYRWAREARGHGVPEVMIAVADHGGRIRPQVSAVKAVASAVCIGTGGSVGREGPIVQIGSALASSLGQWVRMPGNRMRILVACGAGGGIAATFNAPVTGVFFGLELILREFSVEALFPVMLSAMVADVVGQAVLGDGRFLSGFPAGVALHHSAELSPCRRARCHRRAGRPGIQGSAVPDRGPVRPGLEGPARVGQASHRRSRSRAAVAGAPADVRRGLPGHVQGSRWRIRPVVPDRPGSRQDDRRQPDHRHRRLGRGVRTLAVHRRDLRAWRSARSPITC